MDEREANIDLLFRNGLKDYEALPPAEAWDIIVPAIRKQQKPYIILRVAAMIAVLTTLSFLTYTWNNEVTEGVLNSPLTEFTGFENPQVAIPQAMLLADAGDIHSSRVMSVKPVASITSDNIIQEKENNATSGNKVYYSREGGLSLTDSRESRTYLIPLKGPVKNSISIYEYPTPYLPEVPVREKKERWTIAALVSPTYLSSFQTGDNDISRQLNSAEQPLISYAGGLALSYKVSRRFSVQSGLYYASYGNELTGITSFGGFQNYDQMKGNSNFEVLTTNGTVFTNNADIYLIDNLSKDRLATFYDKNSFDPAKASLEYLDNSLRQNLSYLEVPVILRYKIVDRAIDFNIIGGLSSNLLVNNSVYTSGAGGKYEVGKTEGLNTISFSSSLGMGMEYSFSKNLSLNLEPTIRYFLNPVNNIEGIKVHPYSFGIFSGISYKF